MGRPRRTDKISAIAEDRFGGRRPTSHERLSGAPWDASYTGDAPAPWDIGGPQPAVVRLVEAGGFRGAVLDAGCGLGENALHIAATGLPVLGVDVAETALARARVAAVERGVDASFEVADAFDLAALGRVFDTVLDSGLFHAFDETERLAYAASLAAVTGPGATVFVLCFADEGDDVGPHPVSQRDLRAAFAGEWEVVSIAAERVHTTFHGATGAAAWLATLSRRER